MSSTSLRAIPRKLIDYGRFTLTWRHKVVLITLLNVTTFFILWELFATYSGIPRIFLPKLSLILADIPQMHAEGILLPNLWVSVKNFVIGVVIGVAIGLPLALVIGGFKVLDRIFSPYLWAFFSMPRIILVPLVFLWLGIDNKARLAIVIISVIPAFAVVVMEGVKTTDPTLLRVARVFGANRWRMFTQVILPSITPFVGTGLRMGILRGLIGLYVAELFITANGLGSILAFAKVRFNTPRVFVVLLIFIAFAIVSLVLTRYLETKLTTWRAPAEL
jgi:NitT/TauT family transport system permease protein